MVDLHFALCHFLRRQKRETNPKEKKADEGEEDTLESVLEDKEGLEWC